MVNPLLQLAATRGRLMELLADRTPDVKQGGRDLVDQAFMVGILSLMPALLGGGVREILAQWDSTLLCRTQKATGTSFQIFIPLEQRA